LHNLMLTSLISFEILFFSKRKKYYWEEIEKSYQIIQKLYHQINYFKSYKPLKIGARFYLDTR